MIKNDLHNKILLPNFITKSKTNFRTILIDTFLKIKNMVVFKKYKFAL